MQRLLGTLLFVALVALGCSGDDGDDDAATADTEGETTSSTVACEADDADPAELEALITDDVPDGFTQEPDDVGDTGPSDLAKAVSDDGADGAEEVLTDAKFRRGYQRLWTDDAGDQLIVIVYEFCEPEGVLTYHERSVDALAAPESGVEQGQLEEHDDVALFTGESAGTRAALVLSPSGTYLVQVVAYGDATTDTIDGLTQRASDLLDAQLAEL